MSRLHCAFENRGDELVVTDLESANGTLVNGCRVTRQELSPGDVIGFGGSSFRFET